MNKSAIFLNNYFLSLYRYRELTIELVRRELKARFKGSSFGALWYIINPLLTLSLYTFVFGVVFKAKWGERTTSTLEYALVLFTGLAMFNLFAEVLGRAPNLIIANTIYVKKIKFPLEILTWNVALVAIFNFLVTLLVIISFDYLINNHVTNLWYWIPVILIPPVLIVNALGLMISAVGVYWRDLQNIIGFMINLLLFSAPIFFTIESVPEKARFLIKANPLTSAVESLRGIILWNQPPNLASLAIDYLIGIMLLAIGFFVFQKLRKNFADYL